MNQFTKTKCLDYAYDRTGRIATAISNTINVLVKADAFLQHHRVRDWNHLTDAFNQKDILQKIPHTSERLTVCSDFGCVSKQQDVI